MRTIVIRLASGMAVLLVSTAVILAQSATMLPITSTPDAKTPNPADGSHLSTYAPTEIAASASGAADDRRLPGRRGGPRSSSPRTPMPWESAFKMPRLCFQPGVGWTSTIDADVIQYEGIKDGSLARQSGGNGSAHKPGVASVDKSPNLIECTPMPVSETGVFEAESHSSSSYWNHDTIPHPLSSIIQDNGFPSLLPTNSDLGHGNSAYARLTLDIHQGFTNREIAEAANSNSTLAALKALRHQAYISPIKARLLRRNLQEIETRLELRRMNADVEKRRKIKKGGPGDVVARGHLTGHQQLAPRNRWVKRTECARESGNAASGTCSQLKKWPGW